MHSVRAADITVQPAAGSGFVIKDTAGSSERLRVQESGLISLPSVPGAPTQSQGLCMSAGGQLGPCSGGTGGSYTAATGLTLSGTTFSVAPTYRLPQGCTANQIAQWDGAAWNCGSVSGASLPAGTVNQTLRYDASNALAANNLLQAFADGGLVAGGTYATGSIPATGAGARLMWYPANAAFRVGSVDGSQWDDINIGSFSIATGYNTVASGAHSTAMGKDTTASGIASTATGYSTLATNNYATSMGRSTLANAESATAMGLSTIASGQSSTAMGQQTVAGGLASTAMGSATIASGDYSTAMGSNTAASGNSSVAMGNNTTADGNYSVAVGRNVSSGGHVGSFIYGDAFTRATISNSAHNQFMVVASGGITMMTSPTGTTGAVLAPGSGSWAVLSDRDAKTAVQSVDAREVLKKVAALPLNTWQYKAQDVKYRHMGPMAQDFYAAFQLGESDKGIDTVDADGVALAAIQGVNALLTEKDGQIAALREEENREISALRAEKDREITSLNAELAAQKTRVTELESLAGDLADVKAQLVALRNSSLSRTAMALREP